MVHPAPARHRKPAMHPNPPANTTQDATSTTAIDLYRFMPLLYPDSLRSGAAPMCKRLPPIKQGSANLWSGRCGPHQGGPQ